MKTDAELLSAANENFVASYRKLVEHSPDGELRQLGGVFAFVTGLPLSLFNGCVVVEPAEPAELEAGLSWLSEENLPHRVFIAPELAPALRRVPQAFGLDEEASPYPGMVLHPPPEPPMPAVGVSVLPVDECGVDEFLRIRIEGGLSPEVARKLFPATLASDPDVQLYTARLDGQPAGASLAIRSDEACGVYAVGTLGAARRRGVGTALTWAVVGVGRAWACDTIVLQSSAMGLSMYEAMGFRTIVPYATFSTPRAG